MNASLIASYHRSIIVQAMETLMYAVGTPIPGEMTRKMCVQFRPRQRGDRTFFGIGYGSGCSATVRNQPIYVFSKLYFINDDIILQVGYWADTPSWMTLNNPGCFYSGVIQHELMHILGK